MAAKDKKNGALDVTVFVPRGKVNAGEIKKAALLAARDKIPVAAFDVKLDIAGASDVKTSGGVQGRDYTVAISFTPRRTSDDEHEVVTVDKVLTTLEPLTKEKLDETLAAEPAT